MQKVILVGFGFMGGIHAQAYAQIPEAKIVAIVDTLADKAREQGDKIGLQVPIYGSLSEALKEVEADVVDVCLPTDLHAEAVLTALAAKKNVFCEKPLTISMANATKIKAALKKSKTKFMVGQCLRFWPEYQAFEEFVKAKKAGKLLSLTLQRRAGRPGYSVDNWLNKGKRSMGAAVDLHIHDTDYVTHLLGTPKAVFATATKDFSGYSHIFTTYIYKGVSVQAEGGWNYGTSWGFQMAFQAVFENGSVEMDSTQTPSIKYTIGNAKAEPLAVTAPNAGESKAGTGNLSSLGGYYNELRYFIDCLEKKATPKIATLEHGAESLRVVLAELKSAETGKIVKL
jgi:predicted dehydrogenase